MPSITLISPHDNKGLSHNKYPIRTFFPGNEYFHTKTVNLSGQELKLDSPYI